MRSTKWLAASATMYGSAITAFVSGPFAAKGCGGFFVVYAIAASWAASWMFDKALDWQAKERTTREETGT